MKHKKSVVMIVAVLSMFTLANAYCEETLFVFFDEESAAQVVQSSWACSCGTKGSSARTSACSCGSPKKDGRPSCSCSLDEGADQDAGGAMDAPIPEEIVFVDSDVPAVQRDAEEGNPQPEHGDEANCWRICFGEEILSLPNEVYVRNLQAYLNIYMRCVNSLQRNDGEQSMPLEENGIYDEPTKAAVQSFQEEQGLFVNGDADEQTKQRLFEIIGNLPSNALGSQQFPQDTTVSHG